MRELNLKAEAHAHAQEGKWQRTAWLAANVINLFADKPVSAQDLLHPPKIMTPEEREEAFKELWRRHKNDCNAG